METNRARKKISRSPRRARLGCKTYGAILQMHTGFPFFFFLTVPRGGENKCSSPGYIENKTKRTRKIIIVYKMSSRRDIPFILLCCSSIARKTDVNNQISTSHPYTRSSRRVMPTDS